MEYPCYLPIPEWVAEKKNSCFFTMFISLKWNIDSFKIRIGSSISYNNIRYISRVFFNSLRVIVVSKLMCVIWQVGFSAKHFSVVIYFNFLLHFYNYLSKIVFCIHISTESTHIFYIHFSSNLFFLYNFNVFNEILFFIGCKLLLNIVVPI